VQQDGTAQLAQKQLMQMDAQQATNAQLEVTKKQRAHQEHTSLKNCNLLAWPALQATIAMGLALLLLQSAQLDIFALHQQELIQQILVLMEHITLL